MTSKANRSRFMCPAVLMAWTGLISSATVATASTPRAPVDLHLARGPLGAALEQFALQSHLQLLYRSDLVAGLEAPALSGRFTADDALHRLVAGSGIIISRPSDAVVVLTRAPRNGGPSPVATPLPTPPVKSGRHHVRGLREDGTMLRDARDNGSPDTDIIVTGSHIRGDGQNSSSPIVIVDRDALDRRGRTTIAQALADLPQNFSGMATEQSALTLADGSGTNASLATGINLRGLGAGATLVLVNGRRLAGSGTMGDFNDISNIPSGAVDRVEVLLDGASALYGSDAVGGVVNIILKERYDGAQTRATLGSVTSGGSRELQLGQLLGKTWASGSLLLSYEYYHRSALASDDRDFARSSDLRPLGGTDHRQFYSSPGNILALDPTSGAFGPAFAIVPAANGSATLPAFLAGATNLDNQRAGTDLVPRQSRHSFYSRLAQDVGDRITFSADGRYSRRTFAVRGAGSPAIAVVTAANPFFLSPTGAAADLIAYDFTGELGPSLTTGFAETIGLSAGADVDLGRQWKGRAYAAYAQQRESNLVSNIINTQLLSEALGTTADDPLTSYSPSRDGFFNPYGDGSANGAAVLGAIGTGYQLFHSRSRVTTYSADADGPLFDLPGGSVKLAIGTALRHESFVTGGSLFLFSAAPIPSASRSSTRTVKAAFAELRIPLVAGDNARPGLQLLELTAAGRIEHYDDFGTTTNPKVGLVWTPLRGVRLRSSYGTSFRAPNLREIDAPTQVSATVLPQANGATSAVILLSGGNRDLKPEKAVSWSAGLDLAPPETGLRASAGWFRTSFKRRIARPALDDLNNALINPAYAPFVAAVSPATSAADLARVTALLADPSSSAGNGFPASSIGAIVDARYVNTGRTTVDGVDLAVAYTFMVGRNHVDLAATGSEMLHFRERLTPTAATIDNVNLAGKPVHFRGRVSSDWSRGDVGAGATINYVNATHDVADRRIGAWTTVDLQLRYAPQSGQGAMQGLRLALNVQNLLARDPPFYDSPAGVGYDAANADALGRFVSLQLTKDW